MVRSYLDHGLGEFLDQVAARQPAPGGGAVAAVTVSLAASLVAMAARYSADLLDDSEQMSDDAERLKARASGLVDDDAAAYGEVISAYAALRDADGETDRAMLTAALTGAAEVPLSIADAGAETAELAARLAADGKPDVRGDAATAVLLADAATRAAVHLVAVNVAAGGAESNLTARVTDCVRRAQEAARSVG
ncbi:MAG: cyclodeaminase/cyclohydrolase family protein [Nocardioidaceae bacterium]|nr:cyclodeaminase/cyclohydrolase family protein [Nocardioidaceae bacterium]